MLSNLRLIKMCRSNNKIILLGVITSQIIHSLSIPLRSSKDAEERVFAPPTFPYWGPFGLTSTALFCPWFIGPLAGSWNRACAGPVPPFAPKKSTTTATPPVKEESSTTFRNPYEENYNFPNPFPPPVLRIPYDHSFYPFPNGLAVMAQRQDGQHHRTQQHFTSIHHPATFLSDQDKK